MRAEHLGGGNANRKRDESRCAGRPTGPSPPLRPLERRSPLCKQRPSLPIKQMCIRVRAGGGLRKHSRLRVPSLGSGEEGGGGGVFRHGGLFLGVNSHPASLPL